MTAIRSGNIRSWLCGVIAAAIAVVSAGAQAQVTGDETTRISEQQRIIHVLDLLTARMERAQQEGNCDLFERDRAFLDNVVVTTADVALFLTPEWIEQFQERLSKANVRGCTPRNATPATSSPERPYIAGPPLPQTRAKEPDWDADLYMAFRERVEGLRLLHSAGQCNGAQGYNSGLEWLRADLDRSFEQVSNVGGEELRNAAPVIAYFDNWHDAASVLGCTQIGESLEETPASPPPVARPASPAPRRPPLHAIAGNYDTDRGTMRLTETGGTYGRYNGRITITRIDGDNVEGTWVQDGSGCGGTYNGRFRFRFDTAGFTGTYGECDEAPTARGWVGARNATGAAPPPPVVAVVEPPPSTPAAAAPPAPVPAADPRHPVSMPGFQPLPSIRPAAVGWNQALYQQLSERVTRIGMLREQGKCDDYNYSMQGLKRDFADEIEYASTSSPTLDDFHARRAVVDYFEDEWAPQALLLGCSPAPTAETAAPKPTPPPPPPVPAAPLPPFARPGFVSLPDVRPAERGWNVQLYQQFRDLVENMGRLRELGQCANYDRARAGFDGALASAQRSASTQLDIDGDNRAYFAQRDVISYFRYWTDNLRNAGCTPFPG